MDEQLHNSVDKLFRESLHSYKEDSAGELWNKIKIQLDKDDHMEYKSRRRRLVSTLFMIIAGFGIFALSQLNRDHQAPGKTIRNKLNLTGLTGTNREMNNPLPPNNPISNLDLKDNIEKGGKNIADLPSGSIEKNEPMNPDKEKNILVSSSGKNPTHPYFQNFIKPVLSDSSISEQHTVSGLIPETKMEILNIQKYTLLPVKNSQEKTIIKPGKRPFLRRLSITTYFSQEIAGYNLSDDDATAADGREIEKRERNVFSASAGIYLNYKIIKNWVIQSGISYSWSSSIIDSSKSFAVKDNSGNVQFKMNTISGYGYLHFPSSVVPNVGDSVLTAKAYSQLNYLTIPLVLSYKIPMKRFSLLIGGGASFNLLTSATVETKIYGPNFRQDQSGLPMYGLKKINIGIILKAELEYHLNSKFGIVLIPSFKNVLSPINIHSALSAYPYNFGLGAGISYRF